MTIKITTDITDGLAPHDGIEIELMLAGRKNIAYFERLPEEALPHIDSGQFQYKKHTFCFEKHDQTFTLDTHFLYLPDADDDLRELISTFTKSANEKNERRIGQLFGYSEKSIDIYIEHLRKIGRLK